MSTITIAANQGEIGGGEVMLLAIADACREIGHDVTVVAPATPGDVIARARENGHRAIAIPGDSSARYLANLRRWDARNREGLLWCNGLRPAFATAGRGERLVHLHQLPVGRLAILARVARWGALRTLVPSHFVAESVPGASVMWNWTGDIAPRERPTPSEDLPTIGYLGRLSADKGVLNLSEAVTRLSAEGRPVRLLLAGEARFTSDADSTHLDRVLSTLETPVERAGWMDRTEFFSRCDVAVFPSVAPESFGLVAAEAMAAECPFVISDAGALPEVAGDDHPFSFAHDDVAAMTATLHRALEDGDADHSLRRGRDRWQEYFSPSAGTERVRDVLTSLFPLRKDAA